MILVSVLYSVPAQLILGIQCFDDNALRGCDQGTVLQTHDVSKMTGDFTLNPTSINPLMRPEERIIPFGLKIGNCGAIRLLRITDILSRSRVSISQDSHCTKYLI